MRSPSVTFISIAIATATGGISLYYIIGTRSELRSMVLSQDARIASIRENAEQTRRVVGDIAERPDRLVEVRAPPQAPAAASSVAVHSELPSRAATPVAPTSDDMRDSVEARFVSEAKETRWSRDAEVSAREQVAHALPHDSRLLSLECRSSMCRAETSHKDMNAFQQFMTATIMSPDFHWDGQKMTSMTQIDNNGGVIAVAYLGREDRPLYQAY